MDEAQIARAECYFLSYSRSDEAFALKLARDVRAHGVSMWVDQLDIRPSEHWDRAIERAVRDCRGLVVVLSPRSVASDNVADEISFAIDSGKSVLPVMIERCTLPLRITRMQVIDATGNYQRALDQCLAELRRGDVRQEMARQTLDDGEQAIDGETLRDARLRLTAILGPIAGVLADKASSRAKSVGDLYRLLSLHIEEGEGRERFLASVGSASPAPSAQPKRIPSAEAIPAAEIARLAKVLTRFVGPIAPTLARRESAGCRSIDELKQRLSSFIPSESERALFLREVNAG